MAIIIDLIGAEMSSDERELLQHPLMGGIILFSRNYVSPNQLVELCHSVREARSAPLLITVDQEGGRVQRFKQGFVRLPSMGEIGALYQHAAAAGLRLAYCCGWLMAAEILAHGIDLSFAPVLDLNKKLNTVIGDRAFDSNIKIVTALAEAVMQGMHAAGMVATGKHFPGHGSVTLDSHLALPKDVRDFESVYADDMQPFIQLIKKGIDALMPAHIVFSSVDPHPVGFSRFWLQDILRKKLNFTGVIFSDDLNMGAAAEAGGYTARAIKAFDAGCDFVLICNNRTAAIEMLEQVPTHYKVSNEKLHSVKGKFSGNVDTLYASVAWKQHVNELTEYRKTYENH